MSPRLPGEARPGSPLRASDAAQLQRALRSSQALGAGVARFAGGATIRGRSVAAGFFGGPPPHQRIAFPFTLTYSGSLPTAAEVAASIEAEYDDTYLPQTGDLAVSTQMAYEIFLAADADGVAANDIFAVSCTKVIDGVTYDWMAISSGRLFP